MITINKMLVSGEYARFTLNFVAPDGWFLFLGPFKTFALLYGFQYLPAMYWSRVDPWTKYARMLPEYKKALEGFE